VNSEGFRETLSEERQKGPKKAKMAGKKEAKQKAGPCGQTEKNREETESSAGTKNTSEEGGQSIAQRKQPQAMREQGKQRPEEGAQGQRKFNGKDIQEGWETIKEIDRVLGHPEGRLDKVTAVIRKVAVQGKALELVMPEEGADCTGSRESSEKLEAPALQSSTGEHRIVDIEPAPGALGSEGSQEEGNPSPSSAEKGDRREEKNEWPSLEEQRRRAEEEYGKLGGLSHGCRQSWDLRMREEKNQWTLPLDLRGQPHTA
jgi:hypothetical protein